MAKHKKGTPLDGVLLLDKPIGKSSNFALQKCKWLFNAKKAGHTGSLDPIASGMLPILFGQATKYSHFLLSSNKCYQVKLLLGVTTTTGDSEGEVIKEQSVPFFTPAQINDVLSTFKGEQNQIPPMYSALKFQGRPLYALARQGKTIVREPRPITIHHLAFEEYNAPLLTLTVSCSKGTYIRTLAEDIGNTLGTGAHVVFLRRLWVEPYTKASMLPLPFLESLEPRDRLSQLISLDEAFSELLPFITLSEKEKFYLYRGIKLTREEDDPLGWVVIKGPEQEFLGVGQKFPQGQLVAWRLMQLSENSQENPLLSFV